MLLFGAPEHDDEHSFHAAQCALLMQRLIENENKLRVEQGLIPVNFRIGLNTGDMLAGNMGSTDRMEYTVVGDSVNLASRLCSVAEPGQIVVSKKFYSQTYIQQRVIAHEHKSINLRGVEGSVTTYLLHKVSTNFTKKFNDQFIAVTNNTNWPAQVSILPWHKLSIIFRQQKYVLILTCFNICYIDSIHFLWNILKRRYFKKLQ